MTAARKAWVLSIAVHTAGLGALGFAWGTGSMQRPMMEIVDVRVGEAGATELVVLDEPAPRMLPSVAALPLPEVTADSTFSPISPAANREPTIPLNVVSTNSAATPKPQPPQPLPNGAVTTFFGVPAVGKSVVYVIDRSASMGLEGRLTRAVREVEASLCLLPVGTRFQVITYARSPEALRFDSEGLASANPEMIDLASSQLQMIKPEGGTDHAKALKAALFLDPDVVYFLTDEDDLTSADVREVTEYNRGRTSIHTICLVAPSSAATPIQELARRNRGLFRVAQ